MRLEVKGPPSWPMARLPAQVAGIAALEVAAAGEVVAVACPHSSRRFLYRAAAAVEAVAMVRAALRLVGLRLAAIPAGSGQPRAQRCRPRKAAQPRSKPAIHACFASPPAPQDFP